MDSIPDMDETDIERKTSSAINNDDYNQDSTAVSGSDAALLTPNESRGGSYESKNVTLRVNRNIWENEHKITLNMNYRCGISPRATW